MKSVSNTFFDELLRINVYRDITGQLRDHSLITGSEYEKIARRIDAMEENIIKPQETEQHRRKATAV